jgi:hypothetical protein
VAAGSQRLHPPGPGFIDLAGNKSGDVVRVYLPADANSLLAVAEQALVETNVCNIIVVGQAETPAVPHARAGPRPRGQGHRPMGLGQQRPHRRDMRTIPMW